VLQGLCAPFPEPSANATVSRCPDRFRYLGPLPLGRLVQWNFNHPNDTPAQHMQGFPGEEVPGAEPRLRGRRRRPGRHRIPATSASAVEPSACSAGTDAIDVPFAFSADNTPELAGSVCVVSGTTQFASVNVTDGWAAEVRSDGTNSSNRTDVRFTQSATRDRVELRYEPGRTEIK